MKKYLLLVLLAACGTEKQESPRSEIVKQQNEVKAEYKRLQDSLTHADEPDINNMNEQQMDSAAKVEGMVNRRLTALKVKSDSLSNVMKAFELDSIAKSR